MKEIEGRLHTPGVLKDAHKKIKIAQNHLMNNPAMAYLHPFPRKCDYLFIRPKGPLSNPYFAIIKIDGIISKDKITPSMRPPVTGDGLYSRIEDVQYDNAFLFSNVTFIDISPDSVRKLDGSLLTNVNDMTRAKIKIEDDVFQQLTKKLDKKIEPLFSDEINLIKNEEKIKAKLEPFFKEDKKKKVDSMFDELLPVSNSSIKKEVTTSSYERDARLSLILKEKYSYTCQVCGIKVELLNNENYLEAHHIIPLSERGEDALKNMIAVCPNCHIRFDNGAITWNFLTKKLIDNIRDKETELKINYHL